MSKKLDDKMILHFLGFFASFRRQNMQFLSSQSSQPVAFVASNGHCRIKELMRRVRSREEEEEERNSTWEAQLDSQTIEIFSLLFCFPNSTFFQKLKFCLLLVDICMKLATFFLSFFSLCTSTSNVSSSCCCCCCCFGPRKRQRTTTEAEAEIIMTLQCTEQTQ